MMTSTRDERDDREFQERVAAIARLVAEEPVDVAHAFELRIDLTLPVRQAQALGCGAVDSSVVRVADDFERVACAVGQLQHVHDEQAQRGGLAGFGPAAQRFAHAAGKRLVDDVELAIEQRVVGAQLEQLRIGELEDVRDGVGAVAPVVDERGVPLHQGQVVYEVGEAKPKGFVDFTARERRAFVEQERGDVLGVLFVQGQPAHGLGELLHLEDEVVFDERFVRIVEGAPEFAAHALDRRLRVGGEAVVGPDAVGDLDVLFPRTGCVDREAQRDHAVVEELDAHLARGAVDLGVRQRCQQRGCRELKIGGRGVGAEGQIGLGESLALDRPEARDIDRIRDIEHIIGADRSGDDVEHTPAPFAGRRRHACRLPGRKGNLRFLRQE